MNKKPNDGGPAFPVPERWDGMMLRDYFAGQALKGIISAYSSDSFSNGVYDVAKKCGRTTMSIIAEMAYDYGEAMIEESEKRQ